MSTNRAMRRAAPATVNPDGYRVVVVNLAANQPAPAAQASPRRWLPGRKPAAAESASPPQLLLLHDCGQGMPVGDAGQASVGDISAAMGVHTRSGCRR